MAVSFRYAARSDLGTVRTNNEDSAFASPSLVVLADGMGGHAAGEVASTVASKIFTSTDTHDPDTVPEQFLVHARKARRALFAMSDADPHLESMGTTLIAASCVGGKLMIGHIGDSRLYILRDEELFQVTTDHTHVQHLIDTGQLTPERARTHPYRSMLLKSLDDQPAGPDIDIIEAEISPGDRILACSDGLSDYVEASGILRAVATGDVDEAADALIETALAVGTRDNVTVVVADPVWQDSADDGAAHPLEEAATAPVWVGALDDGIALSQDAQDALAEALPDFDFDPAWPMGKPAEESEVFDADEAAEVDEAGASEAGASEVGPGALTSPDADGTTDENEPGAVAATAVASTSSGENPAPNPPRITQTPGILAGAATIVLLVLLAYMLTR